MGDVRKIGEMSVAVFASNAALGQAAAADFAATVKQEVSARGEVAIIFATGNSQLSFLQALHSIRDIPWEHVIAFHMDEYLGISEDHPASFRHFIREKISEAFHPHATYGINGDAADIEEELARYDALLKAHPPAVCVLGIGENGHLAFNDPPADFHTTETIHVVALDETCRRQQVGEGHFANLDAVPQRAITLTIPMLLQPRHVFALVPEARKAKIVQAALEGPVTENCPASILRTQRHVKLYLDQDSARLLNSI